MNKEEAIGTLQDVAQRVFYRTGSRSVYIDKIVEIINQIDEPQKPVIPQFVAEWIEAGNKVHNNLSWVWFSRPSEIKMQKWLDCNTEKFMRAYLDGYEVEQEKLYTVEIPNPNLNAHTILQKTENGIVLVGITDAIWKGWEWRDWENSKLTEAEIKKDFEWAWDAGFAEEVE